MTDDGLLRVKNHGEVVAEIPNTRAGRRGAGLRPADGPAGVPRRSAQTRPGAAATGVPARTLIDAAGFADHRQQALGLPAVRQHGPHQHARRWRAWAPASSASRARRARWRCRPTATDATATSIPRSGAMLAVAEAARNVACAGGLPIGATNCLNFGNPEKPGDHVAVRRGDRRHRRGLPRARHADHRRQRQPLQRNRRQRHLSDADHRRRRPDRRCVARRSAGRSGSAATTSSCSVRSDGELGGSEYLKTVHGMVAGDAPALDLDAERAPDRAARRGRRQAAARVRARLLGRRHRRHACGVLLRHGGIGCTVDLPGPRLDRGDWAARQALQRGCLAASSSRSTPGNRETLLRWPERGVPLRRLAGPAARRIQISIAGAAAIDCSVVEAEQVWASALGRTSKARQRRMSAQRRATDQPELPQGHAGAANQRARSASDPWII